MKTIGVCGRNLSPGRQRLFDLLGEAMGVLFRAVPNRNEPGIDAWVVLDAVRQTAADMSSCPQPCYIVLAKEELIPLDSSPTIHFSTSPALTALLRGRQLTAEDAADAGALPDWSARGVLAFKQGRPIWALRSEDPGHHIVALQPPELDDCQPLFSQFSGQRLACLLPLVLFVQSLTEEDGWQPPPLQAALMFDDPNLHWTSYGFVDYAELAKQANAHNYHVSFATIPLDAWFVHPSACRIFRDSASRLSLLYHGNDHVSNELARSRSSAEARALLSQAVARIGVFESRTGLAVARVMAPPHGACNEITILEMSRLGFEALCVSRGSLRYHNSSAEWMRTIGMRPCDAVAGLPVIPRFGLSTTCHNDILVAALLHQPIVAITHHQALADGYDLLNDVAAFVNSLGCVQWQGLESTVRSLYARRVHGGTLSLRPLSRRITVIVPAGVEGIDIDYGAKVPSGCVPQWRSAAAGPEWQALRPGEILTGCAGDTVELAFAADNANSADRRTTATNVVPIARRVLTETRDRVLPSVKRLVRSVYD